MNPVISYLARGKIYLLRDNAAPQPIESRFGQEVRDRAVKIQQRHSWKEKGRGAQFMSGGLLWGMGDPDPAAIRIAVSTLTVSPNKGDILYALETDEMCGVFEFICF